MHKILFLLIVVLLTSFSFGQQPWHWTNGGFAVTNIYTCPDTTEMKTLDINEGNMVYLRGYTSGSSVGEGWFITTTTAISGDATNVIDHRDSGTRFVRMAATTMAWTARSAAEANSWRAITYGNGLFVAVSTDGDNEVMTSPDGINWTARLDIEDNNWQGITYGNGLFVACASSGTSRIMTSPDGINWTGRTAIEFNGWRSITYGNGLFVAVAADGNNQVMTSPDGISWTARADAEDNQWYGITYGNGLFVAVSQNGTNRVMTSPDGITWTIRTVTEESSWKGITYGNGLFVAVAVNGTNQVMTSPDGINWTNRTAAEANQWWGVVYGNGLFVAISTSGTNRVMTSPDGINWTSRLVDGNAWEGITYGNGLFVACASSGTNRVMTSGKQKEILQRQEVILLRNASIDTSGISNNSILKYNSTTNIWAMGADSTGVDDVSKVGTPVDNQIGVWTGDGTLEGSADLTFDGSIFSAPMISMTAILFSGSGDKYIEDSSDNISFINGIGSIGVYGHDGLFLNSSHGLIALEPYTSSSDLRMQLTGTGVTIFESANDGNPIFSIGSSVAEDFMLQPNYDSGGQGLDYILFNTLTASATANKGLFKFKVDDSEILNITDSGLDLVTGKTILVNGNEILGDTITWNWGVMDTVITGDLVGYKVPYDITLIEIASYTDANTTTFNIEERAEATPNTAGTDALAADQVADNNQQEATSFSNAGFAKDTWMCPNISASGDVERFGVTVRYIKQ